MGSFPHSCDTYSDRILLCPQRARPMLGKSPGSSRGGQDKNKDATHPPDSRSVFPMVCREWAASRTRYTWASPWAPVLLCTSQEARRPLGFQNHVRRGWRGHGTWKQVLARQTPLPSTVVPGSLGWEQPGGGSSVGSSGRSRGCSVWSVGGNPQDPPSGPEPGRGSTPLCSLGTCHQHTSKPLFYLHVLLVLPVMSQ